MCLFPIVSFVHGNQSHVSHLVTVVSHKLSVTSIGHVLGCPKFSVTTLLLRFCSVHSEEKYDCRVHHASAVQRLCTGQASRALACIPCAAQSLTRGFFRLHLVSFVNEEPAIMQSQNGSIDAICAVCQNWLTGADHGHVAVIPIFLSEPVAACTACHGMFAALASTCDEIVCNIMQRDPEPIYVTALVPDVCRSMDAFAAVAQLQPAVDSRLYMRLVTMSMLKSKQPELQLQKNGCIGVEVIVNIRADAPERKLSRSDSMPMTLVKHFAHLEIGFNVVREPV